MEDVLTMGSISDAVDKLKELFTQDTDSISTAPAVENALECDKETHTIALGIQDLSDELRRKIERLSADEEDELTKYENEAQEKVRELVKLIVEPSSDHTLKTTLETTPLMKSRPGKWNLIWYDVKLSGEATNQPAFRVPPLKTDRLRRVITGMGLIRGNETEISDQDVYGILDGGRHGNASAIINQFALPGGKPMKRNVRTVYIAYSEESMQERCQISRGLADQMEFLHLVTAGGLLLTKLPRKHFGGTNTGNFLGPLSLQPLREQWQLTLGEKVKLYGFSRQAVEKERDEPPEHVRQSSDIEPATYWGSTCEFYDEVLLNYHVGCVLDATACCSNFAMSCIENNVPYIGLVRTEDHLRLLTKRLASEVLLRFATSGSSLHRPGLDKLLGKRAGMKTVAVQGKAPKRRAKQQAKKKAAKSKAKVSTKGAKEDTNNSDGADEEAEEECMEEEPDSMDEK